MCRSISKKEMGKKQTPKVLQFRPSIHWIYQWVEPEVLGTPSVVSSEFLGSLREENLLTPEGEYEEYYTLEVPNTNERCVISTMGMARTGYGCLTS